MNKTYRISLQSKIVSLVYFLLFLFLIVLIFAGPGILRDPIKWFFHTIYLMKTSMLLWPAFILLITALFAFLIYRTTKYSVSVGLASITLNLPFHYGFKQTQNGRLYNTIQFADITRAVYTRFPQSVRIYSRTHMTRIIPLISFEGKEELLETLNAQLGEKLIRKNIDPLVFSQIGSIGITIVVFMTWMIEPFDFSFVWTPVIEKPAMTFILIQAYSLDEDGRSTWIVDRKPFSDTYRVMKVTGRNIESWENLPSDYRDIQVSHDGYGNPVIIKEKEIIRWQDGEWGIHPFEREKLRFQWRDRPTVLGTQFWGSISFEENKKHEITHFDFASNQSELIPLPPGMEKNWLSNVQVSNDGSFIVEMKVEEAKWLYVYKDGQWIEPGYPLEKGTWMFDPIDYCVDAEGRVWILQGFSEGFRVGRFLSDKNQWDWISLNPVSSQKEEFTALQVDQRGRLWLQGQIDYHEFVRVFEVLPQGLYELEEYNEYNSKLPRKFHITLGLDGKMWVAGDNLAYIDSNAPELPKPAPDWLAAMATITARMVVAFLYLCVTVLLIGVQAIVLRKKQ